MNFNIWLNFGSDPDDDDEADAGIIQKEFYHCETGALKRILLITREAVDEFLWNVLIGEKFHGQQTDFGADPGHDLDIGSLFS